MTTTEKTYIIASIAMIGVYLYIGNKIASTPPTPDIYLIVDEKLYKKMMKDKKK